MIPEIIQGGLGAIKLVSGLLGSSSAKQKAEELARTRPKLGVNQQAQDALSLAESDLAQGMSAQAENAYGQGVDRDLSTSIDAILKGGGSTNNIGDIFDRSQQGRIRNNQLQDNLRLNQINNLVRAQQYKAEEDQKRFEFNDWRTWSDAAQANGQARQSSNNNIWGGLGTIGSAGMSYFNNKEISDQLDNYFKPSASVGVPRGTPNYSAVPTTTSATMPTISPNAITHGTGVNYVNNYSIPNSSAVNPEYNWGNFSNDLFR